MFLSPDGKTLRMIISHRGDPTSPEGLSHIEPIKLAAIEAVKGTPLEDAKIELGGTAATFHDMADGARYDLMIAGISALCLIFLIMLSFVASLVIVGTVLLSLGASFGLSVIIWQYILGKELHWMVMQMAIIRLGLQPAARLPAQGRTPGRPEDGHDPGDGRHRQRGDLGRPGFRLHHDGHGDQRPDHHRSGGHHDRPRSAVRHAGSGGR